MERRHATRRARCVPLHSRAVSGDGTAQLVDDPAVLRLRHGGGHQRAMEAVCWPAGRPGSRAPSTCPPRWATTPTTREPRARSARSAWPSTRSTTCEVLLDGLPLDEVTTSMTINATASILLLLYQLVAEEQRRHPRQARRHDPERHPQGVRRPRHLHLSAPAVDAAHHRHLRLLRRDAPAVEHDLHLRLPHPRGGLDGRAGDRLHPGQRHRLRRSRDRGRPRRRRLRSPAELLLERPQQLLRGGGQVPGVAADVGEDHERALRRQEREVAQAALPHPDRRIDAHRPAAREQRRPGHDPGPGRGPGRHAEPAHQRLRRGDRPADGAGCSPRAAHPADHRRTSRA